MKKRLIFVFCIAICAMLFAISASAKDAYVEPFPEHLLFEGEQFEYFIVIEGEEYYNIGQASGTELDEIKTSVVASAIDKLAAEGGYPDAVTGLGTKYLIKFVFPAFVNGVQVTHVYLNNTDYFKGTTYFKDYCGAIVYAPTHTSTGDANNCANQLRSIDFGEGSQIKSIPHLYMGNARKLKEIKNMPILDTISYQAFYYCCSLSGVLYIDATTIETKAFENAIQCLDGIIIGPNTVTIKTEAFGTRENANGSKNIKFIEFQGDITKMNIVTSASNQGAFYFASGSQRNPYSSLTCLILSHPDNQAMITEGVTTFQDILPSVYFNGDSMNGGNLVKKGHDKKVVSEASCYSNAIEGIDCVCGMKSAVTEIEGTMLTVHNYIDDFDCTTCNYCENFGEGKCDKFLDAEATSHNEKISVTYADGFAKGGLHSVYCENSTCNKLDKETALEPMILTNGGYSTNGNGGLAGGWTVDTDLVTLFNDYNEKDVRFGIFMVNPSHLASEKFMTGYMPNLAEGKSGALIVEMTGSEYSNFAFQISGFNSDEFKKLELVITAYAYVEGEDVEYIQDQSTVCKVTTLNYNDGSLYTVSYEKASSELSPVSVEAVVPTIKKENF